MSRPVALLLPLVLLASFACSPGGRNALRARAEPREDAGMQCESAHEGDAATAELAPLPEPEPDLALRSEQHRYFAIHLIDASDGSAVGGATLQTTDQASYTSDRNGAIAFYEPGLMGRRVFFSVRHPRYEAPLVPGDTRGATLMVVEGGSAEIALTRSSDEPFTPPDSDLQTRLLTAAVPTYAACLALRVIDRQTRNPVPLVMLEGAGEQYITDSQGMVAYCNPDRIGESVTFAVTTHGYQLATSEARIDIVPGTTHGLELERSNVAERLYRSTGYGIDRDSVLLGLSSPLASPLLTAGVMAQDAVSVAPYRGELFWLWGNTDRPDSPIPNFRSSAARSPLPGDTLDPRLGVDFEYFVDADGVARSMVDAVEPAGRPTWLGSLFSVPDSAGADQLFAVFTKPNLDLSVARRGLVRFDPGPERFVEVAGLDFATSGGAAPDGQPVLASAGDEPFVYFATGVRVSARAEAVIEGDRYEQLATPDAVLRDATSGIAISASGTGGLAYNAYRQRFIRIVSQVGGATSLLGEVWYAEADTPIGPWVYARKILSHDRYTFYAPWIHADFAPAGSRFLYFEGTYTSVLEGDDVTLTPRYHRNQMMYRLDLDDARLALPVAIYDLSDGAGTAFGDRSAVPSGAVLAARFYAPDRPAPDTVPVFWSSTACTARLRVGGVPATRPLFHAVAPDAPRRAEQLIPLYERELADGRYAYDVDAERLFGAEPAGAAIAYVWPNPSELALPVGDFVSPSTDGDASCVKPLAAACEPAR